MLAAASPSVLALLGICAGVLTTLAGQGGGLFLLIALASFMGPHAALAVSSPALLLGNLHRAFTFRRYIDRPIVKRMILGALPGSIAGGFLVGWLPAIAVNVVLVVCTILAIAKAVFKWKLAIPRSAFVPAGFGVGAMTGTAGGAGVLLAPILLAAGLSGPAFVATTSLVAFATHTGRVLAYGWSGMLGRDLLLQTAIVALSILAGNALGERLRACLAPKTQTIIEYGTLGVCVALSVAGVR